MQVRRGVRMKYAVVRMFSTIEVRGDRFEVIGTPEKTEQSSLAGSQQTDFIKCNVQI